tara:strand:- start:56166 stop:57365 length:1200 start_codon:yes stop_codon:yes gene_type:complete
MRILFITPRFPYPALKGDQLIVLNRLKGLGKDFKIVLLTFYEKESELQGLKELEKYCEQIIPVKLSRFRSNINILKGLFGNKLPLQVNYFTSSLFQQELHRVISTYDIDMVHAFTLRLGEHCKNLKIPVIYELIDSMQLNLENMVREEQFFKKWLYRIEEKRIKVYEKSLCKKEKYLTVVSKKDKEKIGSRHIQVIPNGVDLSLFKEADTYNNGEIIFSGNMGYLPNIHAVRWFVNECLPTIKQARPNVKFNIVGANPSSYIKSLHDGRTIFVSGFVESIKNELNRAQIAVAPMRSGSGMQNKIIEAMACGTPVVTTHNGLEGLFADPDEDILVADTPNTFSQAVIDLLSDNELYTKIATNSCSYVNKFHSWVGSNQMISDLYLDALSDKIRKESVLNK